MVISVTKDNTDRKIKWDHEDIGLIVGMILAVGMLVWILWRVATSGPDPESIRYQRFGSRVHIVEGAAAEVMCRISSFEAADRCRLGDKIVFRYHESAPGDLFEFVAKNCRAVHPVFLTPEGLICVKNAGYVSSEIRDKEAKESGRDE